MVTTGPDLGRAAPAAAPTAGGGRRISFVLTPVANCRRGGALVYLGAALVAVLTQIDPSPGLQGWCLEVGFGPCDRAPIGKLFADFETAIGWIESVSLETAPK